MLTIEKLEEEMRNVFGIDGRGLKWKARRLFELLKECPEEVLIVCDKLGEPKKNKQRRMMISKIFTLAILTSFLLLSGCEQNNEPSQPNIITFSEYIDGIMHQGQEVATLVKVNEGATYDFYVVTYNDGDADIISVFVDGNKMGDYRVPEKRMGGNGWYLEPYDSPTYRFTATNENVNIMVRVDVADSWGTWPKRIQGTKVQQQE